MSDDRADPPEPAERRLGELLVLLADDPPTGDPQLTGTVVRRARVQRAIVTPLRTVGTFVVAVSEGVRIVIGLGRREGGP
jgi:hypothetical protein